VLGRVCVHLAGCSWVLGRVCVHLAGCSWVLGSAGLEWCQRSARHSSRLSGLGISCMQLLHASPQWHLYLCPTRYVASCLPCSRPLDKGAHPCACLAKVAPLPPRRTYSPGSCGKVPQHTPHAMAEC